MIGAQADTSARSVRVTEGTGYVWAFLHPAYMLGSAHDYSTQADIGLASL